MILIADSGSTKTSWCLVSGNEKIWVETEGFNPYYIDSHYISNSIRSSFPASISPQKVEKVFYYGAGCSPEKKHVVEEALSAVFTNASVSVESDMLAAARALLGNNKGFAAILGTGTNTCIYDGDQMADNVDSLGYMLGDEGSGSYIGKKLIRDFIRKRMPEELASDFAERFKVNASQIIENVYSKPLPNRYCASFAKFLSFHPNHSYTQDVIRQSFRDFFENLVSCYPNYREYTFNSCGSIAFHFREVLEEVAAEYQMEKGEIVAGPLQNLVEYHLKGVQPGAHN